MTNEELLHLLKRYDKHLWGINATYTQAAKMLGIVKVSAIKKILFERGNAIIEPDGRKIYDWIYRGNLEWYKNPDQASRPKTPTKGKALSQKQWDRLKQFFSEKRELIESEGSTMEFVIRLCRSNWLPCNSHIVTELLSLKKMTLKGVK